MSKQLTFSAALSVLAMAVFAWSTLAAAPEGRERAGDGAATAHGSLVWVLVRS